MAGTDEDAVAAADDALYVLTAVLLTPAKFPSVLGDDYPEACAALGLAPLADGYGLVLGQDGGGARWTVVIDDVSLVAVAIASWDCGMEYDLSPDERTVVAALPGWPLAVAVAAPGVPAPHDPDPETADGPPLTPPDTSTWGSAQRRLGADEIALQWAMWREQIDDAAFPSPNGGSTPGDQSVAGKVSDQEAANRDASDRDASENKATGDDVSGHEGPGGNTAGDEAAGNQAAGNQASGGTEKEPRKGHNGIRRVLAEARAYVDSPPPLGRVRSSFASGEARMLRADGPGWSLVARTDDIAFVLLDDKPGEVLPVGRGPQLPGLLEALDKMAVRPS
ncbi:hypothetical protein AQJ46_23470 [Streptomyces canus]|uniref:Integral membrane protein n=1 Tax=Streptomyces canus TaxID=58343 RepID=A0A117R2C9_9ACTN|nr:MULTISPECIES: hypothetical protein [Streptomyces]KUN67256.1 hypothetical protein AQJ46_23470 [Streptomyces canus]MDI5910649.1 hypothetical protein [Streptomyces sp. 12257]